MAPYLHLLVLLALQLLLAPALEGQSLELPQRPDHHPNEERALYVEGVAGFAWLYPGRLAHMQLDSGSYLASVQALQPGGEYRVQANMLKIKNKPHWWLPRRVHFLYLALILGALLWIRHYELKRKLLRQQAAIERAQAEEKRRQAEQIAAQAKALEETLNALQQKNEEINTVRQRLIAQDQLATLGQLTAGIAHEIKTPLNFVNNFSELSTELVDELEEMLLKYRPTIEAADFDAIAEVMNDIRQNGEDIFANGQRANSIIRNIMDHSRGTEAQRKPVNLNGLIDENVKLAYHGYRALDPSFNLAIHKDYDASLPLTQVIPSDLGRVLLNIFNNACYATLQKQKDGDGLYTPELHVSTRLCEDQATIKIKDNGPGIPGEVLDKIFLPFFTTKPSGEGNTGLGLSISREVIEDKHGGVLTVDSQEGAYTLFEIILPLVPAQ
jgi:two-component system NtrC family sensor kinase